MNAPVWSVNLVAVVLLVWTYPVAEAVVRLVIGRALTPRDLTVRLMQRWFLRPESPCLGLRNALKCPQIRPTGLFLRALIGVT